ncbi:MAG: putative sugar nucleotidyl transferase, partial [Candidatus Nezhaarchaeales archaeon]
RSVSELMVGIETLLEGVIRRLKVDRCHLLVRDYLSAVTIKRWKAFTVNKPDEVDSEVLLVNGRMLIDEGAVNQLRSLVRKDTLYLQDGALAFGYLSPNLAKEVLSSVKAPLDLNGLLKHAGGRVELRRVEGFKLLNYPWELIEACRKMIIEGCRRIGVLKEGELSDKVMVYGGVENVLLAKGVEVEAFVTLDARGGPIFIDEGAIIQSGSRISGPAYVGKHSIVRSAIIGGGTSIGPVCRVGGEVEETIIQGYSNKQHLGFLGHSYMGEWVNIGAGTTNSDLKNTYGTIKVKVEGRRIDTGRIKVGCFIGDYVKTSIGTYIYTGIRVGVCSHLHGFILNDVPSFTIWGLDGKPVELDLESAIRTQKRVFERRNVTQTEEDVALLKYLFEATKEERVDVVKGRLKVDKTTSTVKEP